jgi:hypothetical protein
MSQNNSPGCSSCKRPSLVPLRKDKWGRCALCMALALAGAVTGWSFTLSFWLLCSNKRIVLGLACLSLCFTLVLLLHIIAYRRRVLPNTPPNKGVQQSRAS